MINFKQEIAYICSPYRGDIKRNKEYARELTKKALDAGYVPITPHLYLTEVLDDEKEIERTIGLTAGLTLLRACDKILIGKRYGISSGMITEIETAKAKNIEELDLEACYEEK